MSQNILMLWIYFGVACQYVRLNIYTILYKEHFLITIIIIMNIHCAVYHERSTRRDLISVLRASIFGGHSFIYLHSDIVAVKLECVKEFFSSILHSIVTKNKRACLLDSEQPPIFAEGIFHHPFCEPVKKPVWLHTTALYCFRLNSNIQKEIESRKGEGRFSSLLYL